MLLQQTFLWTKKWEVAAVYDLVHSSRMLKIIITSIKLTYNANQFKHISCNLLVEVAVQKYFDTRRKLIRYATHIIKYLNSFHQCIIYIFFMAHWIIFWKLNDYVKYLEHLFIHIWTPTTLSFHDRFL